MVRIGSYQLDNPLWLAPMAGITDRPFRQLCRKFGVGMVVSEMVSADAVRCANHKTLRRLDHQGESGPISVQLVGAEPNALAEAARFNVDLGAEIIDLNMGCPAKKVCKIAAGSALLKEPQRVARILEAVVAAVTVPVTLKIRTGWDQASRNGVAIARIAEQAGICALAVHGRTRACGFSGQAEYDTIRAIKQAVKIPVIANGDIDTPEKARQVLDFTGADAVMIGRAAQGRPWLFQQISTFLANQTPQPDPEPETVGQIVLEHLDGLYHFYGEYQGLRIARKHLAWYSKGRHQGATFRRQINQLVTAQQQQQAVKTFFAAQ